MGKVRVKTIGDEETEQQDKKKSEVKRAEKKARSASSGQARFAEPGTVQSLAEQNSETESADENKQELAFQGQALEPREDQAKELSSTKPRKNKKEKFKKQKSRSSNYSAKVMEIDKNKTYSLSEALEVLKKVNLAKFDETVELHINTTEAGINGTVKLPHGTGKEIRIAVASDALLQKIESGKIDFDILIATPDIMPKLAKVAKVLGPKGLMPNPKNGTISENPEEAMKKFQGGQISFKTESKVPVMHLTVGKLSFGDEKLSENIRTIIAAIKKDRITQIVLKSTMSPAIRLQV